VINGVSYMKAAFNERLGRIFLQDLVVGKNRVSVKFKNNYRNDGYGLHSYRCNKRQYLYS